MGLTTSRKPLRRDAVAAPNPTKAELAQPLVLSLPDAGPYNTLNVHPPQPAALLIYPAEIWSPGLASFIPGIIVLRGVRKYT